MTIHRRGKGKREKGKMMSLQRKLYSRARSFDFAPVLAVASTGAALRMTELRFFGCTTASIMVGIVLAPVGEWWYILLRRICEQYYGE
jgi:hypothetical protein